MKTVIGLSVGTSCNIAFCLKEQKLRYGVHGPLLQLLKAKKSLPKELQYKGQIASSMSENEKIQLISDLCVEKLRQRIQRQQISTSPKEKPTKYGWKWMHPNQEAEMVIPTLLSEGCKNNESHSPQGEYENQLEDKSKTERLQPLRLNEKGRQTVSRKLPSCFTEN